MFLFISQIVILSTMADGDSTNDVGSDLEVDTSAADADVEDEELLADG